MNEERESMGLHHIQQLLGSQENGQVQKKSQPNIASATC